MPTTTITASQVSQPVAVGAGSIVTVTPGSGATATVEYTGGSRADIANGVAVWSAWAKGAVSAAAKDYCGDSVFMRVTASGGTVVLDINGAPSASELAAFTSDWGIGGVQFSYDASGNVQGIAGLGPVTDAVAVPRIVLFGDSYANYDAYFLPSSAHPNSRVAMDSGLWHWVLGMIGYHRFRVANYAGIGGNTAAMMRARYATDVAAYDYDILFGDCGINDLFVAGRSVADTLDDVKAIIGAALAAGKSVVWATCPTMMTTYGSYSLAKQKLAIQYNRELTAWAVGKRRLRIVNLARTLMNLSDTAAAAPRTGVMLTSDKVHLHGVGSYLFARDAYATIEPMFPARAREFTPLDGLNDGWSNSILGVGAGAMTGTTGTANNGVTAGGNGVPTGWLATRSSGATTTGVANKVADNGGDWLELTVTGNGAATFEQYDIRSSSMAAQLAGGDTFSVSAEIEIDASGGAEIGRVYLRGLVVVSAQNLFTDWNRAAENDFTYPFDRVERLSVRTPTVIIPDVPTTTYAYCSVFVRGTGTVKIRVRNVHALKNTA